MRRLTQYTTPEYVSGTTRLKRVFAFLPHRVGEYIVWLERYEVLETYITTDYKVRLDGIDKAFRISSWVAISERIILPTVNIKQS